jgi:hypothetical protein
MPTILEEFLVSVKFAKDSASEEGLLESLKKIAGTVGGVATAIVGLGAAVFELTKKFAELGDASYFMAQRLGSTVADIDATAFAMSQFGVSTDEAKSAMEGLGAFSRSYGPIATNFMRNLGITATDTEGRMRQLGEFLRRQGFEPGKEGTMGYAMGLRWGHMLAPGASEQTLRGLADPHFQKTLDEAHEVQRHVFGIHGSGAEAEAERSRALETITAQAHKMAETLSLFSFMFGALSKQFSGNLFSNLQPQFERLFKTLEHWLPTISKALGYLADIIGVVMSGINNLALGLDLIAKGINWLSDALGLAIPHLDGFGVALAAIGVAAMANPFGIVVMGLLLLLSVLDDFRAYMQGGKHYFNWEGLFKGLEEIGHKVRDVLNPIEKWVNEKGKALSDWADNVKTKIGEWGSATNAWILQVTGFNAGEEAKKFTTWAAGILAIFEKWVGDKTGAKFDDGFWGFFKSVGGVDLRKLEGWTDLFKQAVISVTPMGKLTDIFNALSGTFEGLSKLWILLVGEKGEIGLLGVLGKFIDKMSVSILSGIRDAWGFIADIWDRMLATAKELLGLSKTGGGAGAATDTGTGTNPSATPGTGPAMTGPEQVGMRDRFMNRLRLDAGGGAAIVNNIMGESGGRPDAVSSSGARGLVQWIPKARWAPLVAWARANNIDPETREGQEEMVAHDLEVNYPQVLAMLRRTDISPEMKARIFSEIFEAGGNQALLNSPEWYPNHTAGANALAGLPSGGGGTRLPSIVRRRPREPGPRSPAGIIPQMAPPGSTDILPNGIGSFNDMPLMPGGMGGGGRNSFAMNNDTDIHVYGSTDPVATAREVGGHQERVLANLARLHTNYFG